MAWDYAKNNQATKLILGDMPYQKMTNQKNEAESHCNGKKCPRRSEKTKKINEIKTRFFDEFISLAFGRKEIVRNEETIEKELEGNKENGLGMGNTGEAAVFWEEKNCCRWFLVDYEREFSMVKAAMTQENSKRTLICCGLAHLDRLSQIVEKAENLEKMEDLLRQAKSNKCP